MQLTNEQTAINNLFTSTPTNLTIEALAGSGKTYQLQMLSKLSEDFAVLYFNKRNAEEALLKGIYAITSHSLGYGIVRKYIGGTKVDRSKFYKIVPPPTTGKHSDSVRLVSYLYEANAGNPCTEEQIEDAAAFLALPSLPLKDVNSYFEDAISQAMHGKISFSDMLVLPVHYQWPYTASHIEVLGCDEIQDFSPLQLSLIKLIDANRLVGVGDPHQALYAFRGADINAFQVFQDSFPSTSAPLTTCFRCSRAVVEHAATIVPQIRARKDAPQGAVLDLALSPYRLQAGDAVLCRNNKPLLNFALECLKAGKRVNILGRDYCDNLLRIIYNLPGSTNAEKLCNLPVLRDEALATAPAHYHPMLRDRWESAALLLQDGNLTSLFVDNATADIPLLSTIHRAKGLEWDRVWLLRPDLLSGEGQDINAHYVAITRARHTFIYAN